MLLFYPKSGLLTLPVKSSPWICDVISRILMDARAKDAGRGRDGLWPP
jgi:hypothetical protein